MKEEEEEDGWYVINDLDIFIDKTRAIVFNSFGKNQNQEKSEYELDIVSENDQDEFNKILSHDESINIAKSLLRKQTNKHTLDKRYLVSDKMYYRLVSSLNERMIGNILNNLVNKGLVEAAFDSEANDFVFWCKDSEDDKDTKPETD